MKKDFTKEYATALFDLSLEKNKLDQMYVELKIVKDTLISNKEFIKLLLHPQLDKSQKKEIIQKIYHECDKDILYFLYVIVDHERSSDIEDIYDDFDHLYNEYNKVIHVVAKTTINLNKDQIENLKNKLTIKYRHKIEIKNEIDHSIVGGMRLYINNEILDYTIKSQLTNLKSHILKQT